MIHGAARPDTVSWLPRRSGGLLRGFGEVSKAILGHSSWSVTAGHSIHVTSALAKRIFENCDEFRCGDRTWLVTRQGLVRGGVRKGRWSSPSGAHEVEGGLGCVEKMILAGARKPRDPVD